MEKIDKFVIYWYSKIVFNTLNNSTKIIFRKLKTETRKLTAERFHQEFNFIYIYIYIHTHLVTQVREAIGRRFFYLIENK